MKQIKVSQENLKNLMDTQYKFHSFAAKLEHMSPEVKAEFKELQDAVRLLFKEQREIEEKEYETKSNMLDKISNENNFISIWSIHEVDDMNSIFGYVEAVKYEDIIEQVNSEVTWLQLWGIADRLIRLSGDEHHLFIENFNKSSKDNCHHLSTGS